ncbi:hypothetical protein SASPL_144858 [Salvia splendens]|uniref:Uncharacterized protein n=1 Tax=Salvia splendens TaxID=180675 RepID=A0A8X8Z7U4_SALSN|nr:hypothetical protein SASPL_144858 [Salvia splendens]
MVGIAPVTSSTLAGYLITSLVDTGFNGHVVEKGEVIALLDIAICLYEAMLIWRGQLRRESDFAMNFDYTISQSEPCIDKHDYHILRIGVVSGKAIFGPPLEEYWKKKLEEEAAAKEKETSSG